MPQSADSACDCRIESPGSIVRNVTIVEGLVGGHLRDSRTVCP
ncbi:hypothetical protein [Nocardia sp. NPDC002869]